MHADHRSETGIDAQMLDLVVNPVDPEKRRDEGEIKSIPFENQVQINFMRVISFQPDLIEYQLISLNFAIII